MQSVDKQGKNLECEAVQSVNLQIHGMTCQSCASRIERVLNKKPAVVEAVVNFASESAQVRFLADQVSFDEIVDWVNKTGFSARVRSADVFERGQSGQDLRDFPWRLFWIWVCLLPFLVGMLGMVFGSHAWMPSVWVQFLLASVVQFGLALPYYKSAWSSVRGGMANMDVLVMLGTLAIWVYSSYFVWRFGSEALPFVYFESGVMVLAFVRLGKFLEARTKRGSLNSLALLVDLMPSEVLMKTATGDWQMIVLSSLQLGDLVLAKVGMKVACDGEVVAGVAWCDESHLTGEADPIEKREGDRVLAGSMVLNGSVEYRALALGQDTQLGDMIQALNEAQGSKAAIARFADKVAGIFIPTVVGLAILTLLLNWFWLGDFGTALIRAVSVLVIACPCAMGLATPAAIMAGMGVAARHGIWFKDAESLEATGSIDTMVFDKTGTLTQGKPSVSAHYLLDDSFNLDEVLTLSASVEAHANHPLANAIIEYAKQKQIKLLKVDQVQNHLGEGISAQIDGYGEIKVGSPKFANFSPNILDTIAKSDDQNTFNLLWKIASLVAISIKDQPIAIFALSDDLKPDSQNLIANLKQDGLQTIIMSGDRPEVVDYIGQKLHTDQALGGLKPREKADKIKALQKNGKKVAMIGDGINDAPAMAVADSSFAIYQGTDVAQNTASVRLLGHALQQVEFAHKIAKLTLNNIKQNLFFALIYNLLGIPLAGLGLLNPMIAAGAMALSSICVLGNALRLRWVKMSA